MTESGKFRIYTDFPEDVECALNVRSLDDLLCFENGESLGMPIDLQLVRPGFLATHVELKMRLGHHGPIRIAMVPWPAGRL